MLLAGPIFRLLTLPGVLFVVSGDCEVELITSFALGLLNCFLGLHLFTLIPGTCGISAAICSQRLAYPPVCALERPMIFLESEVEFSKVDSTSSDLPPSPGVCFSLLRMVFTFDRLFCCTSICRLCDMANSCSVENPLP